MFNPGKLLITDEQDPKFFVRLKPSSEKEPGYFRRLNDRLIRVVVKKQRYEVNDPDVPRPYLRSHRSHRDSDSNFARLQARAIVLDRSRIAYGNPQANHDFVGGDEEIGSNDNQSGNENSPGDRDEQSSEEGAVSITPEFQALLDDANYNISLRNQNANNANENEDRENDEIIGGDEDQQEEEEEDEENDDDDDEDDASGEDNAGFDNSDSFLNEDSDREATPSNSHMSADDYPNFNNNPIDLDEVNNDLQVQNQDLSDSIDHVQDVDISHRKRDDRTLIFDHVFRLNASQAEVFEMAAQPLIDDLFKFGKNALISAYGAPSTGKTYTILGDPHDPGVMQRSIDYIFKLIGNRHVTKGALLNRGRNVFTVRSFYGGLLFGEDNRHEPKSKRFCSYTDNTSNAFNTRFCVYISMINLRRLTIDDILGHVELDRSPDSIDHAKTLEFDYHGWPYADVTEIEVKTPEEALVRIDALATTISNSSSYLQTHLALGIKIVRINTNKYDHKLDSNTLRVNHLWITDLASIQDPYPRTTQDNVAKYEELPQVMKILRSINKIDYTRFVQEKESWLKLFQPFLAGLGNFYMIYCANKSAPEFFETDLGRSHKTDKRVDILWPILRAKIRNNIVNPVNWIQKRRFIGRDKLYKYLVISEYLE